MSSESHNTKVTIEDSSSDIINASIESDNEFFITSVNHGVETERLNIGSITKWSAIGVITVVVFIVALIFFSQFAYNSAGDNVNTTSSYYEIEKLVQDADEQLNTYGILDGKSGIYRIPIDEAINKMATD